MAIATRAEIKSLLGITETTWDDQIDALIPIMTQIIIDYTNNYFHTSKYISAQTLAFVDSDPDTITDSGSGFVTAGFTDDIDIHVEDSLNNDGIFHVDTVAAGTLTLASAETLIAESTGESGPTITRIRFPKSLQIPLAMLIQLGIDGRFFKNIASESLDQHSISYFAGKSDNAGDIPANIKTMLKAHRKLKFDIADAYSNEQVGGT